MLKKLAFSCIIATLSFTIMSFGYERSERGGWLNSSDTVDIIGKDSSTREIL